MSLLLALPPSMDGARSVYILWRDLDRTISQCRLLYQYQQSNLTSYVVIQEGTFFLSTRFPASFSNISNFHFP